MKRTERFGRWVWLVLAALMMLGLAPHTAVADHSELEKERQRKYREHEEEIAKTLYGGWYTADEALQDAQRTTAKMGIFTILSAATLASMTIFPPAVPLLGFATVAAAFDMTPGFSLRDGVRKAVGSAFGRRNAQSLRSGKHWDFSSDDPQVRASALEALGEQGDLGYPEDVIQVIGAFLKTEKNPRVHMVARRILSRFERDPWGYPWEQKPSPSGSSNGPQRQEPVRIESPPSPTPTRIVEHVRDDGIGGEDLWAIGAKASETGEAAPTEQPPTANDDPVVRPEESTIGRKGVVYDSDPLLWVYQTRLALYDIWASSESLGPHARINVKDLKDGITTDILGSQTPEEYQKKMDLLRTQYGVTSTPQSSLWADLQEALKRRFAAQRQQHENLPFDDLLVSTYPLTGEGEPVFMPGSPAATGSEASERGKTVHSDQPPAANSHPSARPEESTIGREEDPFIPSGSLVEVLEKALAGDAAKVEAP